MSRMSAARSGKVIVVQLAEKLGHVQHGLTRGPNCGGLIELDRIANALGKRLVGENQPMDGENVGSHMIERAAQPFKLNVNLCLRIEKALPFIARTMDAGLDIGDERVGLEINRVEDVGRADPDAGCGR